MPAAPRSAKLRGKFFAEVGFSKSLVEVSVFRINGLVFVFYFLEWESTPNLAAAPFPCPQVPYLTSSGAFCHLMKSGVLDTTLNPPLGFC